MQSLEFKTTNYLKEQNFDPQYSRILVALSGGLDSVSLFHFCHSVLVPEFNCRLFAAHVNHGLRKESLKEKKFVEALCAKLEIPLFYLKLNPATSRRKGSIENWGRKNRYQFFQEVCHKHRIDWVFTAHHLNDQLETIYMRADRGTGIKGLRGIHFKREPNIVRPLLAVSRKEIKKYAKGQNQKN